MDGKQLLFELRQSLEEGANSSYMNDFHSYRLLNEAALDLVTRTKCMRTTQDITTVADIATYDLEPDFIEPYSMDDSNNFIIKYNNGSTCSFLTLKEYEDVFISDQGSNSTTPGNYSIINKATSGTQVTGTATSNGAASGGQCTLADSAADFGDTDDVSPGDFVHNTDDGSRGVVLSVTSTTAIETALFEGTANDWTSSDAYVIQPQGRYQIVLDPPPDTASHTVTVPYVQRPNPVYSDYGVFNFPQHYNIPVVKLAALLYKYRDREPNFGDKWFTLYDQTLRQYALQVSKSFNKQRIKVNLKAQ